MRVGVYGRKDLCSAPASSCQCQVLQSHHACQGGLGQGEGARSTGWWTFSSERHHSKASIKSALKCMALEALVRCSVSSGTAMLQAAASKAHLEGGSLLQGWQLLGHPGIACVARRPCTQHASRQGL